VQNQIRILTVLASVLLLQVAQAQKATPEIAVAYDVIGSNAPAGQCGCFALNGGSVTAAFPLPLRLAAVGQVSGTHAGNIGSPHYDLTLVSYLFGVRYVAPLPSKHISLFAQGLLGGTHSSGSLVSNPNPAAGNAGVSLAGSLGGGIDVRWKRAISFRAFEVDYQPTTFNNNTTSLQNNYRFSAGLVFHL
jgi:outer membrane immunogenic protein